MFLGRATPVGFPETDGGVGDADLVGKLLPGLPESYSGIPDVLGKRAFTWHSGSPNEIAEDTIARLNFNARVLAIFL